MEEFSVVVHSFGLDKNNKPSFKKIYFLLKKFLFICNTSTCF